MYLGRIVEENETEALLRAPAIPTKALLMSVVTPEPGLGVPKQGSRAAPPNRPNPFKSKESTLECHLYAA
jgi:peptide/nickel transport system ATP-binding protein